MSRLCHVDLTVLPLGKEEVVVELYVSVYNLPPLCVALIRSFIIGCGREPTTTSGPIIPLKRTLQERVVETERCSFCGDGHTTLGNIDPDTIVFCNQVCDAQCLHPCL